MGTNVRIPAKSSSQKHRATDPNWSSNVYMIGSSHKKNAYEPIKYRLLNERFAFLPGSFYREELLVVDDTSSLKGWTGSKLD